MTTFIQATAIGDIPLLERDLISEMLLHEADQVGIELAPVASTPWICDNMSKLNWLVGEINNKRVEADRTLAEAMERANDLRGQADLLETRYAPEIEMVAKAELAAMHGIDKKTGELKKKTLKLFTGSVGFTKKTDRIQIHKGRKEQMAAIIGWIRGTFPESADDLIRTTTVTTEDVLDETIRPLLDIVTKNITGEEEGEFQTIEFVALAGTEERVDFASVLPAETMKVGK